MAYVAPTDLQVMASDAPDRLAAYDRFPALVINRDDAAKDSPLLHVTSDDAPTLLLAGVKDDLVPIFHSRNIHSAFEKANVSTVIIEFPEAGHGFAGKDAEQATQAMVAWFEQYLAKKTSPKNS